MDDEDRETPPVVVAAVSAGVAPLPFLGVYAVMFIVHGSFHKVSPPDVTRTSGGELGAGLVALAVFVATTYGLLAFLNGRRRWAFAITQLVVLAAAVDFVVDDTKGGQTISAVVVLTSIAALVLGFAPQAWEHVGLRAPGFVRLAYRQPRTALVEPVAPDLAAP